MNGRGTGGFWGFGGVFVSICEKIFDLIVLGILWMLCCLPFITVGASTAALYYAVVKSVKNNNGYAIREFFRSFRQNIKQGTILWLAFAMMLFVLQLNIGIIDAEVENDIGLFLLVFYFLLIVYVVLMMCYSFPILSRFEMKVRGILKLSVCMPIGYLGTSLAVIATLFCFGAFIYRYPIFFWIVPGPIVFVLSEFIERPLKHCES